MKAFRLGISLFLLTYPLTSPVVVALTIEFETTEVTEADVTVSPDGRRIAFVIGAPVLALGYVNGVETTGVSS